MPLSTKQKLEEIYRFLFEQSDDGIWLALLDEPLPINLRLEEQAEHLFKNAYLAECNRAFAKMYGYPHPGDLLGSRFPQLLIPNDPANLKAIRSFLSSDYQIKNAETHEVGRNAEEKHFLNDVFGIVEDDVLLRVWGRQRDITSRKLRQLSVDHLTTQQFEVLKLTIQGKTLKEIAGICKTSEKSVDKIRSRLKKKFEAKTIPELAFRVARLGLFDIDDVDPTNQLGLFQH